MRVMQRVKKLHKTSYYSGIDNLNCEDGSLTVLGGGLDTTTFWQRISLLNANTVEDRFTASVFS